MILIPFIENAFKHGNIESSANAYIHINLSTLNNKEIVFECKNSYQHHKVKDSTKGIGIKNVKRRLELLYLNTYQLHINQTQYEYIITLKLNTNA
jgi:LytS/YehU family sensor histidine kinase